MRLINDVDLTQVKRIFEVLREETNLFEGMTQDEMIQIQNVFKFLNFRRYEAS